MKSRITLSAWMLLISGGLAGQAAHSPSRSELQADITKLRAELAECRNAKTTSAARDEAIAALRAVGSALSAGANLEEFKKYTIESRIKIDALPNTPENRDIRAVSDLYREAVTFGIMSVTDGKIAATELAAAKELHRLDDNDPERKERAMYDKAISEALAEMIPEEAMDPTASAQAEAETIRSHAIQTRADIERLAAIARASVNQEYRYKSNSRLAKEISQLLLLEAKYAAQKLK